ncbi:MAG: hypothetical protein Q7V05_14925 [Methanoregula sp.]|nr:hypothetical protein [Methanoregula sp.]
MPHRPSSDIKGRFLNRETKKMTIEKLLIDLMLGLPDITVLTFGVVVVACIIACFTGD